MTSHSDPRRYRIGFLQTVMVGNMHRYRMLREHVETDATVEAHWYPLRSWVMDDWLRVLPSWLRVRVRHLLDSARLFGARRLDAVVVHAPEMYGPYGAFHAALRLPSVLVENTDAATRPTGKVGARLLARAQRRTTLFVPWSRFVRDEIASQHPSATTRMVVLHPGLPIERWPPRDPDEPAASGRFRLLFVGGDALRKGLDTLVEAFARRLGDTCELDIGTQTQGLPRELAERIDALAHVRVHLDRAPGSPEVQELFRRADALVLPTRYDLSPWVVLEAMATGVPVIATAVGGIPDMVVDGETGFLTVPDDADALADAVDRLRGLDRPARAAMVAAARRHVERQFDATVNTALLLDMVKQAVDERRAGARPRRGGRTEVTARQ